MVNLSDLSDNCARDGDGDDEGQCYSGNRPSWDIWIQRGLTGARVSELAGGVVYMDVIKSFRSTGHSFSGPHSNHMTASGCRLSRFPMGVDPSKPSIWPQSSTNQKWTKATDKWYAPTGRRAWFSCHALLEKCIISVAIKGQDPLGSGRYATFDRSLEGMRYLVPYSVVEQLSSTSWQQPNPRFGPWAAD